VQLCKTPVRDTSVLKQHLTDAWASILQSVADESIHQQGRTSPTKSRPEPSGTVRTEPSGAVRTPPGPSRHRP